jgi:hypothetical protein
MQKAQNLVCLPHQRFKFIDQSMQGHTYARQVKISARGRNCLTPVENCSPKISVSWQLWVSSVFLFTAGLVLPHSQLEMN